MRKFIVTIAVAIFLLPLYAQAGVPEAVTYLKGQALDDWTAMALAASGEQSTDASSLQTFSGSSATDYAKRILALTALGKNPVAYTGADLVAGLKAMAQGGQLGNASWLNDDAWGILALRSAGAPANDAVVREAAQFLTANQNADGGWSWGVGYDSDTNDTAAVLMALSEAGYASSHPAMTSAVAYLATQQNPDAGFAYQLPCAWPACDASDSASTSWVISALGKLGLDASSWTKGAATPFTFLQTLQTGDGSFKWQAGDPSGSPAMTAYAVVALTGKSYPVAHGSYVGGSGKGSTPLSDIALETDTEVIHAAAGEETLFSVTLRNRGPNEAQAVKVAFELPEGADIRAYEQSGGAFDALTREWTFARVNNYASEQLTLAFVSDEAGAGEARVTAGAYELDIDQANNELIVPFVVAAQAEAAEPAAPPEPEVLGATAASCELPPGAGQASKDWRGFTLRPASDGAAWYCEPVGGTRYCLAEASAAYRALELFGLGISNSDLARIPAGAGQPVTTEPDEPDERLMGRLKGRILLQVESLGEAWYVDPRDGLRYHLKDGVSALEFMARTALTVPAQELSAVPAWRQ